MTCVHEVDKDGYCSLCGDPIIIKGQDSYRIQRTKLIVRSSIDDIQDVIDSIEDIRKDQSDLTNFKLGQMRYKADKAVTQLKELL